MPEINFDQDLPVTGSGLFVKLKSKGEKIKFRLAKAPHFDAVHWVKAEGEDKRIRTFCPKIMAKKECKYCSDGLKPKLNFYYPIVNRETKTAQIFVTSLSVHKAIKGYFEAGIDVFNSDFIVVRNEGDPANFYQVIRADTTPLDKEEEEALKRAKEFNLEEMTTGKRQSSMTNGEGETDREEEMVKIADEVLDTGSTS